MSQVCPHCCNIEYMKNDDRYIGCVKSGPLLRKVSLLIIRDFDKKWTKLVLICPCFVLTSIQLNICSDRVAGDFIVFQL